MSKEGYCSIEVIWLRKKVVLGLRTEKRTFNFEIGQQDVIVQDLENSGDVSPNSGGLLLYSDTSFSPSSTSNELVVTNARSQYTTIYMHWASPLH